MTDTLITASDDTAAAQQATDPAETPEKLPGDPAQAAQQEPAADKPADAETQEQAEYEAFSIPEDVAADEEVLGEFKAIAKELKLSQQDAQKFADLSVKMAVKQHEAVRTQQAAWAAAAKSDKEYGGDAFAENLSLAKSALDTFASPELRNLFNETGLGNHPELIRTFVKIGKQISEDSFLAGKSGSTKPADARQLYSASNMNP